MLYLSTARIPSEKAHAYQIVKMCEAFARQEADVTLLYQKRDNSAWTQDIHDVFAYYGVRVPFAMKQLFCFELPFLGERLARLQFYAGIVCYLAAAVYFIITRKKSIDVIYCRDKFSLMVLGVLTSNLAYPCFLRSPRLSSVSGMAAVFIFSTDAWSHRPYRTAEKQVFATGVAC